MRMSRPGAVPRAPATSARTIGGSSSGSTFRRMNDTLGKPASSLQAADNIDPTVNAMKEVKDVVSPLGRGLFSLFGRAAERKKEVWGRRILKALTLGTQKAQQQAGGGFLGMGGGGGGILGSRARHGRRPVGRGAAEARSAARREVRRQGGRVDENSRGQRHPRQGGGRLELDVGIHRRCTGLAGEGCESRLGGHHDEGGTAQRQGSILSARP